MPAEAAGRRHGGPFVAPETGRKRLFPPSETSKTKGFSGLFGNTTNSTPVVDTINDGFEGAEGSGRQGDSIC
jgi:hypothetical protein